MRFVGMWRGEGKIALLCVWSCAGVRERGLAPCGQAGAAVDRLAVAKETSHRAIIATT